MIKTKKQQTVCWRKRVHSAFFVYNTEIKYLLALIQAHEMGICDCTKTNYPESEGMALKRINLFSLFVFKSTMIAQDE